MKKTYAIITVILFVLFTAFTLAVKFIDVQPIGPDGSKVGFASLNEAVLKTTGTNETADTFSDLCIGLAIAVAALFAFTGLLQLIKRKSFLKVDFDLYALASFYIITATIYVIFLFLAVNFRPVFDDGVLESSYPSSHVFCSVGIFMTAMLQVRERIKNKTLSTILQIGCIVMSVAVVISKLLAGVHWFTDIIGGILGAAMLIADYRLMNEYAKTLQNKIRSK